MMLVHLSAKAGMVLLTLFALLSNLEFFKQTALDRKLIGKDEVALYERRFDEVRKSLPSHGVVGYISSKQVPDIRFDPAARDYYLTQYALSPLLVVYSDEPRWVVGNFHDPVAGAKMAADRNLIVVEDFGNGVMLFRREGK